MPRNLERHIEACRRRGLHVDEDFERGHVALHRLGRGITLTVLLAALVATMAAIVRPSLIDALFAPGVMAPQTHRPQSSYHPHFRRAVVRPRTPRALV